MAGILTAARLNSEVFGSKVSLRTRWGKGSGRFWISTANDLRSPVVPFYPFWGEGSPTKIDHRKKGTLVLASLLEDLDDLRSRNLTQYTSNRPLNIKFPFVFILHRTCGVRSQLRVRLQEDY